MKSKSCLIPMALNIEFRPHFLLLRLLIAVLALETWSAQAAPPPQSQWVQKKIASDVQPETARWCGNNQVVWFDVSEGLRLINLTTGRIEVLTKQTQHTTTGNKLFCSLDGHYVFFFKEARSKTENWSAYDLQNKKVTEVPCFHQEIKVSWDLRHAMSERIDDKSCREIVFPRGSRVPVTLLSSETKGVRQSKRELIGPSSRSWFPDGSRTFVWHYDWFDPKSDPPQRFTVSLYDIKRANLTPLVLSEEVEGIGSIAISDDATSLIFTGSRRKEKGESGYPYELKHSNLYKADSAQLPSIAPELVQKSISVFDVHKNAIVMLGWYGDRVARGNILYGTLDGVSFTVLSRHKENGTPHFAPDGRQILFGRRNPDVEGPEGTANDTVYILSRKKVP